MELYLYNTLTRKKDRFEPIDPQRITMYVCGPTVYNFVHVGNARPAVVFDTLYRLLRWHYPQVIYARNITDVDDKINQAAHANGESIGELAGRFAQAYREDMAELNVLRPDLEPQATDNIDAMIALIERLIANGHAYESEGHVLFAVETMADYGRLSHRSLDDMVAGARVEVADYKRHPGDFVLWKPSKENEPAWPSPWGDGRPGWHLECSAMIERHLGKTIDIHAGGMDLVFPHHENEIAQSCCANPGTDFVRYWLHNGYLTVDGAKMAKSEGNFTTVRDVLGQFPGEAVRYALLSAHYRGPVEWSMDSLAQARAALDRFYLALREHAPAATDVAPDAEVIAALCNDLNTPQALSRLHAMLTELNQCQDEGEAPELAARLKASAGMLGLLQQGPQAWLQGAQADDALSAEQIDTMLAEREQARRDKDFARADAIRDELQNAGIILEDGAGGTQWRRGGEHA